MTLALGPTTVPDQPMSYLLLVTVYTLLAAGFLVKCFLAGFLATLGFALAAKIAKLNIRGAPQGEQGYTGMPGSNHSGPCQCGTDRDTQDAKLAHLAVAVVDLQTEVDRMKRDLGHR